MFSPPKEKKREKRGGKKKASWNKGIKANSRCEERTKKLLCGCAKPTLRISPFCRETV